MKNNPFGKATALFMGSLMIFSGQALAFSSNPNQEFSGTEALGNPEFLVAQGTQRISPQQQALLCQVVAQVANELGVAAAIANAGSIPQQKKQAVALLFAKANTLIGEALVLCSSTPLTKDDAAVIVKLLAEVETLLGQIFSLVTSLPDSSTKKSLLNSLASIRTSIGSAVAVSLPIAR